MEIEGAGVGGGGGGGGGTGGGTGSGGSGTGSSGPGSGRSYTGGSAGGYYGTTNPNVTLVTPIVDYYNDTSNPATVIFNCSVTDEISLKNLSLYITGVTNTSFAYNDTCNVTGTSDSCSWQKLIHNGNYTWNCLGYDNTNHSDWADINWSFEVNSIYNAPIINNIECQEEGVGWYDCSGVQFNDTIYAVRTNCTDTDGSVYNVSFALDGSII